MGRTGPQYGTKVSPVLGGVLLIRMDGLNAANGPEATAQINGGGLAWSRRGHGPMTGNKWPRGQPQPESPWADDRQHMAQRTATARITMGR